MRTVLVTVLQINNLFFTSDPRISEFHRFEILFLGTVPRDLLMNFVVHQSGPPGHLIHWLQASPKFLKLLRAVVSHNEDLKNFCEKEWFSTYFLEGIGSNGKPCP